VENEMGSSPEAPQLQRSLKLWHLIVYGIIIIQPTAPMGIYGVVSNIAHGHDSDAIHRNQLRPHGSRLPSRGFGI
jgi:hypothetical protein